MFDILIVEHNTSTALAIAIIGNKFKIIYGIPSDTVRDDLRDRIYLVLKGGKIFRICGYKGSPPQLV